METDTKNQNDKNQNIQFPQLKYRLVGASTEDPENPFYSLISGNKNSGWSSVRYCTYPQEILIQICRPCRLREIDLVFHEFKIASKIEFYFFFPKTFTDFNLDIDDLIFEKIGYIIPDTNLRTNYQARELKKVFLNENVYYLKLVFHQNYHNIKNLFNQVGLIEIKCYGMDFTADNINGLYPKLGQPLDYFTPESLYPQVQKKDEYDDSLLDEVCRNKIQELKDALELSIKIENFDESKRFNDLIQLVRKIGEKINDAKDLQNKALEINDFDTCKITKNNIELMRDKVRSILVYPQEEKPPEEERLVEQGTQPIEDEKKVEQEKIAVKNSQNGDEDESVREAVKIKINKDS